MAMQTGVGLSKILVLVGAGYTGTILMKNGKLSDLIGELQALVKGLEKSGDSTSADSDPVAAQVRWLAQEVRQLASTRQITVLNGSSNGTDVTSLVVPAAAVGALGYGYMWWKGLSFSDLMYVTKRNMATAVANLTKHLETVSETLAKTKRHLTQRIESLDGKMDDQRQISNTIMKQVRDAHGEIDCVSKQMDDLKYTVLSLEQQMCSFEDKQILTLKGVDYLCNFVDGKTTKPAELAQIAEHIKPWKSRPQLPSTKGLKELEELSKGLEVL